MLPITYLTRGTLNLFPTRVLILETGNRNAGAVGIRSYLISFLNTQDLTSGVILARLSTAGLVSRTEQILRSRRPKRTGIEAWTTRIYATVNTSYQSACLESWLGEHFGSPTILTPRFILVKAPELGSIQAQERTEAPRYRRPIASNIGGHSLPRSQKRAPLYTIRRLRGLIPRRP